MDRIFTPWRYAYVSQAENVPGCIFCHLSQKKDDRKKDPPGPPVQRDKKDDRRPKEPPPPRGRKPEGAFLFGSR